MSELTLLFISDLFPLFFIKMFMFRVMSLNFTELKDIFYAQNQSCLSLEAFYPHFNISQVQGRVNSISIAPELELVHVLSRKLLIKVKQRIKDKHETKNSFRPLLV